MKKTSMKQSASKVLTTGTLVLAAISNVYGQDATKNEPSTPSWLSSAFGDAIPSALADGKIGLNARLRYEHADQAGLKASDAFTVRTRFGFTTAPVNGFTAMIEGENTKIIGPDVNFAAPGNNAPGHTVVADPELTEVNRAWLSYSNWDTTFKAGRQRIIHDGARFLGNVGWRQAEQTFDAVSVVNKSVEDFTLQYAYIFNVKRINDTNRDSDSHAINLGYTGLPFGKLSAYSYLIEFPKGPTAQSSHTYGVSLTGARPLNGDVKFNYLGEFAWQTEGAESPLDYQAEYYHLQGGASYQTFSLSAGYEVLGTDNNVGFYTPLATLAKWNGWADAFLGATPAAGLRDTYVSGTVKLPYGIPLNVTYHHYSTDIGSTDLGDEIDVTVTKKLTKNLSALARYAHFDGSSTGPADRDKFWLQFDFNF